MAPFYFGDFSSEALQHGPHHRISFKLFAQFLCSGNSARRSRNCFYFSTHSYRTAQHFARTGTDLLQRIASFHHLRERALVRRRNSQFRAFQFPSNALIHDLAEKFLLPLNRRLDFRNLLPRNSRSDCLCRCRCGSRFSLWLRRRAKRPQPPMPARFLFPRASALPLERPLFQHARALLPRTFQNWCCDPRRRCNKCCLWCGRSRKTPRRCCLRRNRRSRECRAAARRSGTARCCRCSAAQFRQQLFHRRQPLRVDQPQQSHLQMHARIGLVPQITIRLQKYLETASGLLP